MTQGALIFAQGSSTIDYVKIAAKAAEQVHKHLDIPVTLVTDKPTDLTVFDSVVIAEAKQGGIRVWPGHGKTKWFNVGRSRAFELSPYDTTLLIDSDYWIYSDQLKLVLNSAQPFQCHCKHISLPLVLNNNIATFGKTHSPMYWATVVKFDRSTRSESIFAAWQMIENNYKHYANLFGFLETPFRNDYALSLALLLMSGNITPSDVEIPWPLMNIDPGFDINIDDSTLTATFKRGDSPRPFRISIKDQDLHIMDKHYLESISES